MGPANLRSGRLREQEALSQQITDAGTLDLESQDHGRCSERGDQQQGEV